MNSPTREHRVTFSPASRPPVSLPRGAVLCEHLSVENSPLLFGCRTGICGTCLVEVEDQADGELGGPAADEAELLEIIAPGNQRARLACQIALSADIRIRYIGPA
jgi:ferredoxin